MIYDLNIYRTAKLLVDKHGAEAPIHAAMQADAMLAKGDMDGRGRRTPVEILGLGW